MNVDREHPKKTSVVISVANSRIVNALLPLRNNGNAAAVVLSTKLKKKSKRNLPKD